VFVAMDAMVFMSTDAAAFMLTAACRWRHWHWHFHIASQNAVGYGVVVAAECTRPLGIRVDGCDGVPVDKRASIRVDEYNSVRADEGDGFWGRQMHWGSGRRTR